MSREEFNRYENDKKHKKYRRDKKIRNPISKGSIRSKAKKDWKKIVYDYDTDDMGDE